MDSHVALEQRLELARARRDAQPAYSPDWDAAMGDIDELTARPARLAILARSSPDPSGESPSRPRRPRKISQGRSFVVRRHLEAMWR